MSGILPLLRWTLRNCLLITSSLSAGQGGSVSCTCVLLTYLRYSQRYVNGELHTNGYQGSIANWASWRDTRYVPSSRSLICCLCQYFEWLHHMAWSGCQKAIGKTIFEKKGDCLLCARDNQLTLSCITKAYFSQYIEKHPDDPADDDEPAFADLAVMSKATISTKVHLVRPPCRSLPWWWLNDQTVWVKQLHGIVDFIPDYGVSW